MISATKIFYFVGASGRRANRNHNLSLALRRVGLSQTLYWVHFSSYFCTLEQKTIDNYSMCSCLLFPFNDYTVQIK